ncbi:unnamed protein product [Didymodactylos carnosus]|uniref:Cyclic nucleotide-binding domain-containing protein n=1 Tax=Didymodactylos carnosus TaxID=1234261 RepID=A0A8S2EDZ7_9BILA|nr:unnamed protein product [Didymodactylos carnosus]CAF4010578.1 unnamed protein product [Didymodactylos carnosus]
MIRACLSDIKAFTRLPQQHQDILLHNAWYECYEQRRTIVRQGERAACFYMILSGVALPTYKRATDGNVETLDTMEKGSTFGEHCQYEEEEENIEDPQQPDSENRSMFTEINLSGDVNEVTTKGNDGNALETDFRLSKARRASMADIINEHRTSSSLSTTREGEGKILKGEKVPEKEQYWKIFTLFSVVFIFLAFSRSY